MPNLPYLTSGRVLSIVNIMGRRRETKEEIQRISFGLLGTAIDLSLFLFALWGQSYRVGSGRKSLFRALIDSGEFVKSIKKEYIQRGLHHASERKFLTQEENQWKLAEFGRRRLEEILPQYHSHRPWNGKIYLITYDIPEKRKRDRDLLREYLKRIGCGMFQASVWLTLYDPKKLLIDFVAEKKLAGSIVVSDIGKDGNIGQISIKELVRKVYQLDKLNEQYRKFLERTGSEKGDFSEMSLLFPSILKDDPQLPFSLLPKDWLGDKAYRTFRQFTQSLF